MNIARARELIAALAIPLADRTAILDELMGVDDWHAKAHGRRAFLQSFKGYPARAAIYAAFREFRSKVADPGALLKAIRSPNGRVKIKSRQFLSRFLEDAKSESSL